MLVVCLVHAERYVWSGRLFLISGNPSYLAVYTNRYFLSFLLLLSFSLSPEISIDLSLAGSLCLPLALGVFFFFFYFSALLSLSGRLAVCGSVYVYFTLELLFACSAPPS